MIRYEDAAVERAALSGEAYIAIPFEIYQNVSGGITLTIYKRCKDIAEKFLSVYREDPLHNDGITWAAQQIQTFMIKYGYHYNAEASDVILEFSAKEDTLKMPALDESILLKTPGEWLLYENTTNVDPDFSSVEKGVAFVVVRDGKIISCACINDVYYADGAVEIQVETALQYRNLGLGHMCAASLMKHLCRQGHKVWYKCYERNSASVMLACKCGLHLQGKRASFVCFANV
ncbi:MAG: GNAT family N-acetyltransferase [Clostridiales bacterium]|jgi:RimJ/RimL family protein N-acetyltransferase|nr:GNAT family N-acetyltransferase [Clostridiales bacterium]